MILVVDDEQVIVALLKDTLSARGYEVESASNGVEAYELVKSKSYECMVLDINMPQLNGVELLLLMQADGIEVPTIVMAAFDDFRESEMKQFTNVVRYFPKPFDTEELLEVVKKHAG